MFRLPGGSVGQCQVLLFPLQVLVSILHLSFITPVNPSRLAFELVKVSHMSSFNVCFLKNFQVRRQLEYSIAASRGISLVKPPTTMEAIREILRNYGCRGLYLGFRLHFS